MIQANEAVGDSAAAAEARARFDGAWAGGDAPRLDRI
jgi:hypothetical protein